MTFWRTLKYLTMKYCHRRLPLYVKVFLFVLLLLFSLYVIYQTKFCSEESIPTERFSEQFLNDQEEAINIFITFTKAEKNYKLQDKMKLCLESMISHATQNLKINIIGDKPSQKLASDMVEQMKTPSKVSVEVHALDIEDITSKVFDIVKVMQKKFSHSPQAYYGDALFFLSIGLHKVMPDTLKKVIMLDADLKIMADIKELYEYFDKFDHNNVIGIARDMQPVYRHILHSYRGKNPGTRLGEPPPNGLTGFNSGVLLLNLDKLRKSDVYNRVISPDIVNNLTEKYSFKGHLGDQDLFSLLSFDYEELFYVLPCNWNRQLCTWWKRGYQEVFDLYHNCDGPVKIYHGNCNTPIP